MKVKQIIIIGSKHNLSKMPNTYFNIGNKNIFPLNCVNNLIVKFDTNITLIVALTTI